MVLAHGLEVDASGADQLPRVVHRRLRLALHTSRMASMSVRCWRRFAHKTTQRQLGRVQQLVQQLKKTDAFNSSQTAQLSVQRTSMEQVVLSLWICAWMWAGTPPV